MIKNLLLVVKVGTNVLTSDTGLLDQGVLEHLVEQIVALRKDGHQVLLITSGAVGAGRSIISPRTSRRVHNRQVLASVGQPLLINRYRELFHKYNVRVGQVLATKEDFRDRNHYLNMRNCIQALLHEEVIPIINENDVVAVEELMFTDNDELAGLLASMLNAHKLIILSDVDGVMDRHPSEVGAKLIKEVDPEHLEDTPKFNDDKNAVGRGGMSTKFRVGCRLAEIGIEVSIANGKSRNILHQVLYDYAGTRFKRKGRISNVKKWMAHQEVDNQAVVTINVGAVDALTKKGAKSLLPIGIVAIDGDFEKGELIQIRDEKGHQIGVGLTQYDSLQANSFIGQQGCKPLIHYNYLFISSQKKEIK